MPGRARRTISRKLKFSEGEFGVAVNARRRFNPAISMMAQQATKIERFSEAIESLVVAVNSAHLGYALPPSELDAVIQNVVDARQELRDAVVALLRPVLVGP